MRCTGEIYEAAGRWLGGILERRKPAGLFRSFRRRAGVVLCLHVVIRCYVIVWVKPANDRGQTEGATGRKGLQTRAHAGCILLLATADGNPILISAACRRRTRRFWDTLVNQPGTRMQGIMMENEWIAQETPVYLSSARRFIKGTRLSRRNCIEIYAMHESVTFYVRMSSTCSRFVAFR